MLRSALHSIKGIGDVSGLFASLGYSADTHPFDEHESVVARYKSFKVIATTAHDCRERVQTLARKLAKDSERALAVAISAPAELAIASPCLEASGITKVLVLSLHDPTPLVLEQLEQFRPNKKHSALEHALRVIEVLSSEEVSERFFKRFRTTRDSMAASLGKRGTASERSMAALLALTRILFLYFVQQKGWLDNRTTYLRELLDEALSKGQRFHRAVLDPLFFGTLNRRRAQRSDRVHLGEIPYLNGGLFEPHTVERRLGRIHFSNDIWRNTFDDLFERFRFCVRESDEVDAIAPDMLGRVFERLMEGEQRLLTGTFYTPESLVRQIVDAAIETALTTELGAERARRLVKLNMRDRGDVAMARASLKRLRILDPAVGSGAFLLGALDALANMHISLRGRERHQHASRLRRDILRDNLFGVDINPVAVRLAELRLWLAVVADDPTTDIPRVAPLPNLDGVVRQGDTLLDPIGAARLLSPDAVHLPVAITENIRAARQALFTAQGRARQTGLRRLRQLEVTIAERILDSATSAALYAVKEITASTKNCDLFGKRVRLTSNQRARLSKLKGTLKHLSEARTEVRNGALPFFSFEIHTPDVIASGGFNVIVGNPPWVRAERLSMSRRSTLKRRFEWWRGVGAGVGYAHLPDLSVAFLERCLELTAQGGAVGLLLPSKVLSAGYGEIARRHLVKEHTIAYVHRVPANETVRFGATAYPVALVLRNLPPEPKHCVRLGFGNSRSLPQSELNSTGPWILLNTSGRCAIRDFEASGVPLRDVATPMLGVKTGANGIFVGTITAEHSDRPIVAFGCGERGIEAKLLRPAIRGRDVNEFRVTPRRVILWCYDRDGDVLARLPRGATEHIERNVAALKDRADYKHGPLWSLFRTRCVQGKHRVVWRDIDRQPRAVVLDESEYPDAIPLNTCYVARAPDRETAHAIAAVFNSTWTTALIRTLADEARGGFRRINARAVATIPVPVSKSKRGALAALSLRAHRTQHVNHEEVDEAVADALDISTRTRQTLRSLV